MARLARAMRPCFDHAALLARIASAPALSATPQPCEAAEVDTPSTPEAAGAGPSPEPAARGDSPPPLMVALRWRPRFAARRSCVSFAPQPCLSPNRHGGNGAHAHSLQRLLRAARGHPADPETALSRAVWEGLTRPPTPTAVPRLLRSRCTAVGARFVALTRNSRSATAHATRVLRCRATIDLADRSLCAARGVAFAKPLSFTNA